MKNIFKSAYQAVPFKKELFSLIKPLPIPHTIYQHLHFEGMIKVHVDAGHEFKMMHHGYKIENELFWKGLYGNWESVSMKLWTSLCLKSNVIFDLGANTGVYSLVAQSVNSKAKVHAFEPFPAIYEKLKMNISLNNFQIQPVCKAVSNFSGDAIIYTESPDFAYSVTVNKNLWVKDKDPIELKIKTTTLKDYILEKGVDRIDLMKIDVETHEPEVMEGFGELLKEYKPIILVEILNDEVGERLNQYFSEQDFLFFNIHEKTGLRKVPRIVKSDDFNFLILPKEKLTVLDSLKGSLLIG